MAKLTLSDAQALVKNKVLTEESLKEMQDLNVENDSKKNILSCLGFKEESENPWSPKDIQNIFNKNITSLVLDINGNKTSIDPKTVDAETDLQNFPIYISKVNDEVKGYAIPISGKGLWSTPVSYTHLTLPTICSV